MSGTGYAKAAGAALKIWGAASQARALAKEQAANIEAERQMERLAFNRRQQKFLQDTTNVLRQQTVDKVNIRVAAAEAQDELELHRAGSNLTGASMNELDGQIARGAHADMMASKRATDESLTNLNQQRIQQNENRIETTRQRKVGDYTSIIKSAMIGAAGDLLS
jgi:hypothetical protein